MSQQSRADPIHFYLGEKIKTSRRTSASMGIFDTLDASLTSLVGQWDLTSTTLATILVLIISYRVITSRDPDVHPMLLARQAVPSTVRNEGESAVYRSQAAPHGMPLNSGLNVKDPGASKWSRGRNGDLTDVWRKVANGGENGAKGRLMTVLGSQKVVEHKIEDLTRQINIIGGHMVEQAGKEGFRVAIYLPNSVELLVALFACAFQEGLTAVLIPFDVEHDHLIDMLRRAEVDAVVTASGHFPFDKVVKSYPKLKQLIWVVDEGSSHLDWNEVPEGMGGSVNVTTWTEIINDYPQDDGVELLAPSDVEKHADVVTFWQGKAGEMEEMVTFSQGNIVSGIAGQLAALPARERLNPSDLFLPADSLVHIHTLTVTLAALYSNASVAFNSVAGSSPDLVLATQGIAPTVIVASPETLLRTHAESTSKLGGLAKLAHSLSTRTLTQDGIFSPANLLSPLSSSARASVGTTPGKLRLIYTAERAGAEAPHLNSQVLSDLRIFTGARVVYALASAKVAGAVSQTAFFDYRLDRAGAGHFGAPLTSVEVFLRDKGGLKTSDDKIEGEVSRAKSRSG